MFHIPAPLATFLLAAACLLASPAALAANYCADNHTGAPRYGQRSGPLTPQEQAMARTAWKYFENNTVAGTGLANAVDGYPSTTMWDTASYVAAIVSASELGIIDRKTADERFGALFATLNKLKFFRDELPNKVYHTGTLVLSNYANQPDEIGYSAIDLGRLLIWLKIVKERYPQHADSIDRFVLRWNFDKVVDQKGTLFGAHVEKDKKVTSVQEGRLGYEEYAARGFELWGIATDLASRPEPFDTINLYCVEVPFDSRDPRRTSQHNYVVSESYVLDGLEFNWDQTQDLDRNDRRHSHPWMVDFAARVYQAQENRYRETGIVTARSEHQLDQEPWFVYDTVYTDGFAWNTITEDGKHVPQFAAVSLKAALGMWVLWKSEYTDILFARIASQYDPAKGFYEGVLENGKGPIKAFTSNNNGIMLEALLYKSSGKLLKWGSRAPGLWEKALADPYGQQARTRFKAHLRQPACTPGGDC